MNKCVIKALSTLVGVSVGSITGVMCVVIVDRIIHEIVTKANDPELINKMDILIQKIEELGAKEA